MCRQPKDQKHAYAWHLLTELVAVACSHPNGRRCSQVIEWSRSGYPSKLLEVSVLLRASLKPVPPRLQQGKLSNVGTQAARDPRTAPKAEASRKRQGTGAGKFLDSEVEVTVSEQVRLPVCAGLCRSTVTSAKSRSESKLLEAGNSVSVQCQISVRPARGELPC